jgi:hypothetical protein
METMFSMRSVALLYNEDQLNPASFEVQPITNIKSVQALNINSSSLKYILIVVGTLFQQIVTELNGSESEEDRLKGVTKSVLKWMLEMLEFLSP